MRKFQGRAKARALGAGLVATATVAAAAVTATALPAYADPVLTVSPPSGGLTGTITVSSTGFLSSITPSATINVPGTACASTPAAPSGNVLAATIAKVDSNSATITLPAALAYGANGTSAAYNVCVYDTGAGTALVGHGTYTAAPIAPAGGVSGGNVTITSTGTFNGVTTVGGYYSTTACTSAYATSNVTTVTVTKNSNDLVTVPVPTALTLNSGAARPYYVCLYNGATAGSSALLVSSAYTLAPSATVSPASGVSGAGSGTLTATLPTASAVLTGTTYYAGFSYGGCPSSYAGLATAQQSATVTKVSTTQLTMSIPAGVAGPNGQSYAICVYSASTGDALIATSAVNAFAVTNTTSTLSTAVGAGGGVTITMSTANTSAFATTPAPAAVFFPQSGPTAQYCPGTYTTAGGTASPDTRRLTNGKATITLPTSPLSAGAYSACVYTGNTATDKMIAVATYTVASVPSLRSISPASGPPSGNNVITVSGANLPTAAGSIQVSIGNTPVDPSKVTPMDSNTFQFVAPAHPLGASSIVIKTDLGTTTLPGAYRYVNSLSIGPNTAPNTSSSVSLDIFGSNFLDYNFALATGTNVGPHIYLVRGSYDGTSTGVSGVRANVNVAADCANVLVVSDNELACTLDLTRALLADGTQTPANGGGRAVSLTNPGGAASKTVTTGAISLSLADVGRPVSYDSGKISAGTVIAQVNDSGTAVLNLITGAALSSASETVGYTGARAITTTTATTTTVTAAAGTFSQADVGRYVSVITGVPAFTYVTGVNDSGSSATLSQGIASGLSSITVNDSGAVPPGAYNIQFVSDGTPGVGYTTSTLSSGSSFTVSSF